MIEKYYIVENPDFIKESRFLEKAKKDRYQMINDFFEEHGIDGDYYYFSGNGSVNKPFSENEKRGICLSISLTEQNKKNFGDQLKKNPCRNGLFDFKKSSPILKSFQDACIERQVIVNLWDSFIGDYFSELHFGGFSHRHFEINGKMYLEIDSNRYDSVTPEKEGFTEIKASTFFEALEEREEQL